MAGEFTQENRRWPLYQNLPFFAGTASTSWVISSAQLVLDALPDEPLTQLLERRRGHGRNDYPVRPMWNC